MTEIKWEYIDNKITVEEVLSVMKEINYDIPKDYAVCVAENNGGVAKPSLFDVEGVERVFGSLLSYDKNDVEFILKVYDNYKDTLPKELLPIGFDPAGNLICFDYKNHEENPIVVFWEHEGAWEKEELMESEGMTAEEAEEIARENVFYAASTFTAFLNKLHD
ncbi:SMI1/KNR4 family protein [Bacillus pseudomycoides]|uniref:SMI1/KNR4 family protein n=1 Tax=Bacillus pseudomycoides TaxID=64104 RepID=UPI000BEF657B|nr:SMI1/KNR4 family protein [Bacillus pseudomycoides]PEJ35496.1 1,3-beta-glucan synthase regulator [Bacillus pseudomycoides]PHA80577.1 1,3-beta-glucan synthase regulator [Bacillus pseudomycoides]PHC78580.1 1,3-beta-glucan synthase regulator [Bacillus pseudomycoides]